MNSKFEGLKSRLLNTVSKNKNDCWEWNGYLLGPRRCYGLTTANLNGKKKKILAHRLSYILWNGEIPKDAIICHKCDNTKCINPHHLYAGNPQSNMDDMKNRGRKNPAKGIKNRHAKLSESEVLEIRKMFNDGIGVRELSRLKNLSSSTVSYITRNITWKHI